MVYRTMKADTVFREVGKSMATTRAKNKKSNTMLHQRFLRRYCCHFSLMMFFPIIHKLTFLSSNKSKTQKFPTPLLGKGHQSLVVDVIFTPYLGTPHFFIGSSPGIGYPHTGKTTHRLVLQGMMFHPCSHIGEQNAHIGEAGGTHHNKIKNVVLPGQYLRIHIGLLTHIQYFIALVHQILVNDFQSKKMQRSEEHTSELQSRPHLVCRLLLE